MDIDASQPQSQEETQSDQALRFKKILQYLMQGLYEREDIIRKTFLASIAGESIFYLGPPGVAKSLISRRLKHVYQNATNFEYLMNKFSTPEEIFGPISVARLRDEDKLERKIESYLPSANVAFLDEIWKAGPSIQNTLLTIINEKIYRNGTQIVEVPLITLIAASNELPNSDQGLEALWDRFILRLKVNNVSDFDSFTSIVTKNLPPFEIPNEDQINMKEFELFQKEIKKIKVPKRILNLLFELRTNITHYNQMEESTGQIYVSDRRWKKIVHVLKTCAFINGRTKIDLMDTMLIKDMVWDHPDQITVIDLLFEKSIGEYFLQLNDPIAELQSKIKKLRKELHNKTFYTDHDLSNLVSFVIDEYNIFHIEVNPVGNSQLSIIKYIYNWHDKFNRSWLPTEGDTIGLCAKNLTHYETVKVISVSTTSSDLKFSVSLNQETFEVIFAPETSKTKTSSIYRLSTEEYAKLISEVGSQLYNLEGEFDDAFDLEFEASISNLIVNQDYSSIILKHLENYRNQIDQLRLEHEELRRLFIQNGGDKQLISNPSAISEQRSN